nr:helix-turn-helix domain-containing protein [uncultured Neokomagataea sp.]
MPYLDNPDLSSIDLLTVLRALADPIRLEIVRQLHERGEATCAELLRNRPKSSMSHHFHVLRESGILQTRVEGLHYYNSLRRKELDQSFPGLMASILAPAPTR